MKTNRNTVLDIAADHFTPTPYLKIHVMMKAECSSVNLKGKVLSNVFDVSDFT